MNKTMLPEGVPSLDTFYLYITDGCNQHCRHCWITPRFIDGRPSPGECLDLDLMKIAVESGKALGLHSAKLTGGEPILHPRFMDIVDFLSLESIKLIMETNATLIDEDLAKHLKNNSTVWFISTSLDSPNPDAHDRFRGVPGAFKATLDGIGHLVKAGYRPQIIMSPHRGNIHEIEALIKLAIRLGAGSIKFNPVTPTGRGKTMHRKGEALDFEETLGLVRRVRGELQDRYPIKLIISVPPALHTIREILMDKGAGGECQVLHILGILGSGDMAICGIGRNIPQLCFGRLGTTDLAEAWISHPVLVAMREKMAGDFPGVCGDCIHAKRCLTQCVATNYSLYGELVHPFYLCEDAEQKGVFPVTRRKSYRGNLHPEKTHASG